MMVQPTAAHHAFHDDVVALLGKHAGHLDARDMLAIAAKLVGQIIAMQDQRTMTREAAIEILIANIELGNQEVIANLKATDGSA